MRRRVFALTILFLFSLAGCQRQNSAMQSALSLRSALLAAGGCSFRAEITADYGEQDAVFAGLCRYKTDGTASMELTQPESLRGIRAETDSDGSEVSFGGTGAAFGALADGNLAPMAAPYMMGSCWAGEYIESAGGEDGGTHAVYLKNYGSDELRLDVWLSADTGYPAYCEISFGGRKVLAAAISDFTLD